MILLSYKPLHQHSLFRQHHSHRDASFVQQFHIFFIQFSFSFVFVLRKMYRARIDPTNGNNGDSLSSTSSDNDNCMNATSWQDVWSMVWLYGIIWFMVCILKNVFEELTVDVETFLFRIQLSHVSFCKSILSKQIFFSFVLLNHFLRCLAVRIDFKPDNSINCVLSPLKFFHSILLITSQIL